MITQVRCHCCGLWGVVYNWNNKKPVYCDDCRVESDSTWRTGNGRGECQACKMYTNNLEHWKDQKPPMPALYICTRGR
jgi:hypothetical protein